MRKGGEKGADESKEFVSKKSEMGVLASYDGAHVGEEEGGGAAFFFLERGYEEKAFLH